MTCDGGDDEAVGAAAVDGFLHLPASIQASANVNVPESEWKTRTRMTVSLSTQASPHRAKDS
jgi:hypothetical protein